MLERSKKRSGDLWSLQHTHPDAFFFFFFSTFAISDFVFVLFLCVRFPSSNCWTWTCRETRCTNTTTAANNTTRSSLTYFLKIFGQRNKRHRQTHAKKRRAFGNNLRGGWASLPGGSTRTGDGKSSDDDTREREAGKGQKRRKPTKMNNKVKTLKWNKKILKIGRRNKTDKRETHHRGCCCCCLCIILYLVFFFFFYPLLWRISSAEDIGAGWRPRDVWLYSTTGRAQQQRRWTHITIGAILRWGAETGAA